MGRMEWIGKIVQIGNIQFDIVEPVQRCMATTANPETGVRDGHFRRITGTRSSEF